MGSRNKTAMTGLPRQEPGQNFQDKSARIGLPAQAWKDKTYRAERKEKTARKGQAFKGARTGQPELGSQNVIGRTRLPGQNY